MANAFFVAAEFALAKVRPTALEAMAARGDNSAKRAFEITKQLDAYLSATQFGITLASLGLGWVGEPAVSQLLQPAFIAFGLSEQMQHTVSITTGFAVISVLHIVIGELVPKSLAIQQSERVASRTSWLLKAFYTLSYPALIGLNLASQLTLKLIGAEAPSHAEGKLSLDELRLLIKASIGTDEIQKQELIERVLKATDRPIRAIMIPRVDMQLISSDEDSAVALNRIRRTGFSRFPLCRNNNPDEVFGYIYVKDLLLGNVPKSLETIKRDILLVPESRTVGELLSDFQKTKIPIAIAVDEYGGTSGLVTLEDAVAEIVGDVQDEITSSAQPKFMVSGEGWVADGALPLDGLDLPQWQLPEIDEMPDTVGGLVVTLLGKLASPGDHVDVEGYRFFVDDVRKRRVHRVRITAIPEEDADE